MSESSEECLCCKALWIQFTLCQDLPCSSAKACARVDDFWQGELPSSSKCESEDCEMTCDEPGSAASGYSAAVMQGKSGMAAAHSTV
jgi:hypothetical protein